MLEDLREQSLLVEAEPAVTKSSLHLIQLEKRVGITQLHRYLPEVKEGVELLS